MEVRPFGDSGLRVSELCLGTGTFGNQDWGCDLAESRRIFDRFRAAGGNFIDTANKYADGLSEEYLGEVARLERDDLIIGTKFTAAHPGTFAQSPNRFGNHAKSLRLSLEGSLRRLKTDYVDVLWVHAWDAQTSIAEMMRALDHQVRSGKVLALGASNMPAWVVATANTIAQANGWTPFSGIQVEFSLLQRGAERDLLPMSSHTGLTPLAWAPLASGRLTGKYLGDDESPRRFEDDGSKNDPRSRAIVEATLEVAKDSGLTPAQVALAWVRAQPSDPIVLMGARNVAQMDHNLAVLDVVLGDSDLDRLEEVSSIELGVPNEFLKSADGLEFFYGSRTVDAAMVGPV